MDELDNTVLALSEMAAQIGSFVECNGRYQRQLARRLANSGKPLAELTLGELLAMDCEETERYNQNERRFEQWQAEQRAATA